MQVIHTQLKSDLIKLSFYCRQNPMRMLIHGEHFSTIQSALDIQNETDGQIHFSCSDGKMEAKSTHFKLHSKLLSKIMADVPFGEPKQPASLTSCFKEHTVILPDVPKSHISHLMNLITTGKSKFSVIKLSAIESLSDVINEVLSTADLLDISITNYGFDLDDERVLVPKREQEYCEISEDHVKIETFEELEEGEVSSSAELFIPSADCSQNNPTHIREADKRAHSAHGKLTSGPDAKLKDDKTVKSQQLIAISRLEAAFNTDSEKPPKKPKDPKKRKLRTKLNSYICSICGEEFLRQLQMTQHQSTKHWNKLANSLHKHPPKKCPICPKMFVSPSLMAAHMLGYHRKKKFSVPCPECGDMFNNIDTFYFHMSRHVKEFKSCNARARNLQQISTTETTGGDSASASANLKSPKGLPIPTVEKGTSVKSSTWLGSDLLSSTGQAALPPVFTRPTVSSSDVPAPPQTSQISSSSVAFTLLRGIAGEENSSVTPGYEKDLVFNMLASDFPFGDPNKQTNVVEKSWDTPVFGKSLSLLKQKSKETSKSQTKEPSGD